MKNLKDAIIVDIDGTYAFVGKRSFFDAIKSHELDSINKPVSKTIQIFYEYGYAIIFVTGSTEDSRKSRQKLIWNDLQWEDEVEYTLHMRKNGDYRKDTIFKREIYNKYIKDKYNVLFVLEDRNQMVDFYRNDLQIPCFQVNPEMPKNRHKNEKT